MACSSYNANDKKFHLTAVKKERNEKLA